LTHQKHLKDVIRARMARTGESYVTARRQILNSGDPPSTEVAGASKFQHFPGNVPIAAALRIVLANAGVKAPHTGRPFSEPMTFGIGGGIGAGAFAFHYQKENWSSFFIAGRHLWQDDLAWLKGACDRFGVAPLIRESSSPVAAEKAMNELLTEGPTIAWVDKATLPYYGMPAWCSGGGYHVLVVYGVKGSSVVVGDLTDQPIDVPIGDLRAARARIKKQKNRLLSISGPGRAIDLKSAIRDGLKACAQGLVKGRMRNFTLDAFRDWAERLHGSKSKDSWDALFPPGPNLRRGLCSINEFIDHWGTGGGLMRPLMGEFLDEACAALGDARMKSLGERYAGLGREWSALAEAALPEEVPALREARGLVKRKSELFLSDGPEGDEERRAVCQRLDAPRPAKTEPFPLSDKEAGDLRRRLKAMALSLCESEERAQKDLLRLVE